MEIVAESPTIKLAPDERERPLAAARSLAYITVGKILGPMNQTRAQINETTPLAQF